MKNLTYHPTRVSKQTKNETYGHKSPTIWLTGLSGSGKSTIANRLEEILFDKGIKTTVLDGDNVRIGLNKDLGFSNDDRKENMRRIAEVSKLFSDSGIFTITAFISPFEDERNMCKDIIGDDFVLVHIATPIEECINRDPKGLYKKALNGEIKQFTGIDSPYEEPIDSDIILNTDNGVDSCVELIIKYLISRKYVE